MTTNAAGPGQRKRGPKEPRKQFARVLELTPAQIRRFKAWAKRGGEVKEMAKSICVQDATLRRAAAEAGFDIRTGEDLEGAETS